MKAFIITYLFLFGCSQLFAVQNKYALLIGINQYQKKDKSGKTILDPQNVLSGCVNDAASMKDLLINKFNFSKANITTLYDTSASKENIFKQLDILRSKCKKGDVAVVYFAGHGMPFKYGKDDNEIAEVILPSNAFVTVPFAYIQQTELAQKFNLFVDNNVTLTAIFDCCFSLGTDKNGPVMAPEKIWPNDSLFAKLRSKKDSIAQPNFAMQMDADEYQLFDNDISILDESLTDQDTILIRSEKDILHNRGLSAKSYKEMTENVFPYGFNKVDTTYNPPSQRDNSQFVFLSATNDMQTAPEIRDEFGKKHGAFTYAFIKVFENNPITISFKEAFNKTARQLNDIGANITPSARYKPNQREDKNMFGLQAGELKLKVYLPAENCTYSDLNAMYKKWVKPLNTDSLNSLSLTKNDKNCSKVYIMNNGKNVLFIDAATKKSLIISNVEELKKHLKANPYFIYLSVPKTINDSIRKECLKNNKIELVKDITQADVSVYCTNYVFPKTNFLSRTINLGRNLMDDYTAELVFVASNETVGFKQNKAGHSFSDNENIIIAATDTAKEISKKFMIWLNAKAKKWPYL